MVGIDPLADVYEPTALEHGCRGRCHSKGVRDDESNSGDVCSDDDVLHDCGGNPAALTRRCHRVAQLRHPVARLALAAAVSNESIVIVEDEERAPFRRIARQCSPERVGNRLGKAGPPGDDGHAEPATADRVTLDQGFQPRHGCRLDADHIESMPEA